MANKMKKDVTMVQQEYQQLAKSIEPPRRILTNCFRAFLVGGLICVLGQVIQDLFIKYNGFTQKTAGSPTSAVLITISIILTSLGVYDKLAQWAGAGSAVPITGFANSMASSAIEHRSEGTVLGVGGKMFELAGSVIVFGAVSAFVVGLLHWLFNPSMKGGM